MSSRKTFKTASRARAHRVSRCAAAAFALLVLAAAPVSVQAQAAGDLVTLCWNSDNDDDFAIITLAAIPGGTRIFISDNGWSTSQNTLMQEGASPSPNRQIQLDVAAAGIPFGTVIEFDQAGATATLVNPALGTVTMVARFTVMGTPGNGISFGSPGDQLMVWRTANNLPTGTVTMISGFSGSIYTNTSPGPGDGIITQVNGWQVGTLPQPSQVISATSESNAPGGLIAYDGSNAATATALGLAGFNVGGLQGQDNYRYSGPTGLGTKTAYLTAINNPANWSTNDLTPFSCTFGITASPEIAVTGNAVNIADGDATPSAADNTDFGGVDVISATLARTFTITNSGSAALTIGAVTFTGANTGDFSVTGTPASSVAPGGTTTVQVTFNPSAVGLRSATINIANNDADENPFDFAIQGTGTQPEIAVSGNALNIVDGDVTPSLTDHTDFGNVTSGSVTRTFTVSNTGNAPLSLGTVLVSGTNAADFLVTQQPNGPVAGGGSTTFQVSFTPGAAGLRTASLSFGNGDADENPFDFAIQGTGAQPEIAVSGNAVNIADGDNTPSATDNTDFGNVDVISATLARTFTITNSGGAALTIGAVTFTGANPGDFSVTGAPASSVAAGGTTTVQITFNPSAVGLRAATVSIVNNDADENPFDFAIQGTGTQPEIAVSGNAVNIADGDTTPSLTDHTDFGNANVTSGVVTRTFTVSNTGNAPLMLGTVLISGTNAADYLVTQQPSGPVAGAGSTTFQVSFGPGAAGLRTASVSMGNSDTDENPFDFSIQGTGVVLSDAIFANGFE